MKTAFVLSGGGSKGAFQAGVIYQLLNKGIFPDVVYGTSVGAINAAAISYLEPDEIKDTWLNIEGDHEIIWPTGWKKYLYWPKMLWTGGFYSLVPLEKQLRTLLKNRVHKCESYSCVVNLVSGKAEYISNYRVTKEEYIQSVIQSAAIPMLMEDRGLKVDGGVRHHTPLAQAVSDGADKIYVISCRPYRIENSNWKPSGKLPRTLEVGFRAIDDIMTHEVFVNDVKMLLHYNQHAEYFNKKNIEIHLYAPDRFWMDTIDFSPEKIHPAFKAGTIAEETAFIPE